MSAVVNVSRRDVLRGIAAGSLVLGVGRLGSPMTAWAVGEAEAAAFSPDLFVTIAPDGAVTIVAHRSEMGTGIRTALPMVVADELGADWSRVTIEQAPGDASYGSQNTDGSRSIRRFHGRMRRAGATARQMLEAAAAARWGVPATECSAADHRIVHGPSGRSLGFGELVTAASELEVPAEDALRYRSPEQSTIVGTDVPITDGEDIVTGRATFGIDVRREGMLHAVIARSPVLGGRAKSHDAKAAMAVAGVVKVVELPAASAPYAFGALGGIAVLATNTWAATQGRLALNVSWDDGDNASYDSAKYQKTLSATAQKPGTVMRNEGDVDAAFAAADEDDVVSADYDLPHLAHASMEPPCALAEVTGDGCEVWAPTQNPQAAEATLARALGLAPEKVNVHVTLLGGGFGRKSKPDFIVEAALLAREVGRPVHVTWTRDDDIRHDYYHSVSALHLKASVDRKGRPTAWLQRSVFPPIGSTFSPAAKEGSSGEMGMGFTDVPFNVPNLRCETGPADAHVRIGWLRSVAHVYHAFATSSFADELAQRARRDPLEYLLELMGPPRRLDLSKIEYSNHGEPMETYPFDVGRLRAVTELAAKRAGWKRKTRKKRRGRGLGIASHRSFLSYAATVVEVDVDRSGTVRLESVVSVIDAGLVVHPDRVRAQMEGAAVFGASLALTGAITAKNGRVEQSNFHDYPILRMNEAPRTLDIHVVKSDAPPAGVGEVGVPPFAPALTNAIFAATGKRIRRLPIAGQDLSWS
ncbi:MAG: molybdopterin cofactor-binding domain-containing protein [Acidobacteriota bacterium]